MSRYFGITNVPDNDNVLRIESADEFSGRQDQLSIFSRSFFAGISIPFF